jgi:hypothetical protein
MNEIMARALSIPEIAKELRYHSDPGVARLAAAVSDNDFEFKDAEEEIQELSESAEIYQGRAEELELECEALKKLLRDRLERPLDVALEEQIRAAIG